MPCGFTEHLILHEDLRNLVQLVALVVLEEEPRQHTKDS